jgi:ADP-heptose:LPS heptosyltransferase
LNILVFRGGALGDLILTLPVLREIRKTYCGATLELAGIFPQACLTVPDFVDRAERLDSPEFLPLFCDTPLPSRLRSKLERFDLAISFVPDPDSVIARNLCAAGVRRVITASSKIRPGIHAVFQLAEVLAELGITLSEPVPSLAVGPAPERSSRIGLHVGSGSPGKNWPIDRWIELIQRLECVFTEFLLVGGEADEKASREFSSRCNVPHLEVLLNASLPDVCRALYGCEVFVGHDTGITHLAATVGTPTVALFGPTDADVWAPLGNHVRVVQNADGLMKSIGLTEVLEAVQDAAQFARRAEALVRFPDPTAASSQR